MKQYQLIAFDVDGTLLNDRKEISEGNRLAIRRAAEAGKEVVLSTGRCLPELRALLEQLPEIRYVICTSGARVMDVREGKVIFNNPISVEYALELVKAGRLEDQMLHLLSLESVTQRSDVDAMAYFHMAPYQGLYRKVNRLVENIADFYEAAPYPVDKLNFYHATAEGRLRTEERVKHLPLEFVYSEETALECSAPGTTKGRGLLELCQYLKLDPAETIAVGDADNDLDILHKAGLSVAMGNAWDRVKNMADEMVADNEHDGCAEAIDRLLL